jgi:hypothetical protein
MPPDLYEELTALLEDVDHERLIHQWLESHPIAFGKDFAVISQARLGAEYMVDFMLVENVTVDFTWTIVELKEPGATLFRADGLPTDVLNSAIHQVELYQHWISENIAYARQKYPTIFMPRARIVAGRRRSVLEQQKSLLKQMNSRRDIEVMTYDRLLDAVKYTSALDMDFHNRRTDLFRATLNSLDGKLCYNGNQRR